MRTIFEAAGIALLLWFTMGCYALNAAKTTVNVIRSPDGTCTAEYSSNKELLGLEAEVCGGKVKVDKSGSNDAIAAGSLANQLELIKALQAAIAASQKGAAIGAGVPVPVK